MDFFKSKQKELQALMKEKNRADKKLEKEMKKRAESKYTTKFLKEARKDLTNNAMEIDTYEYQQMVNELKKTLK